MTQRIVILGTGRQAQMTYWCLVETWPGAQVVFADDVTSSRSLELGGKSFSVVRDWDFGPDANQTDADRPLSFVLGVGDPRTKEILVRKALDAGLVPAAPLIHPRAYVQGLDCAIAHGVVVFPQSLVMAGARLDAYVTLVANVCIGPACRIGEFVTAYPGTVLAGANEIGRACVLETGVSINEGVRVAAEVRVGAQSCLIKDVDEAGAKLAGVPARFIR